MAGQGRLKSEQWSEFAEQIKRVWSQLFGLMNTSREMGGAPQIHLLSGAVANLDEWKFLMYSLAKQDGVSDDEAFRMFFGVMVVPNTGDLVV